MNKRNDGGPAFPRPAGDSKLPEHKWNDAHNGMSLRDWLAGMALQGLLAATAHPYSSGPRVLTDGAELANLSYFMSDAMLAEREK